MIRTLYIINKINSAILTVVLILGWVYQLKSQKEYEYYEKLGISSIQKELKNLEDNDSILYANLVLGKKYTHHNIDSSIIYYNAALKLSKSMDLDSLFNRIRLYKALTMIIANQPKKAESELQKLNTIYRTLKDSNNLADVNIFFGFHYTTIDNSKKAYYHLMEGLAIATKLKNKKLINDIYNRLGMLFYQNKEYDKSIHYYKIIIDTCLLNPNNCNYYRAANHNISELYTKIGEIDLAMKHLEIVINIRKNSPKDYNNSLYHGYVELANLSINRDNYSLAFQYMDTSIIYAKMANQNFSVLSVYFNKAKFYIQLNRFAEAKESLTKIEYLLENKNIKSEEYKLYEMKSLLFEKEKDYRNAFFSLQQYVQLKDSLYKIINNSEIEKLNLAIKKLQKKETITNLELANEKNIKELIQQRSRFVFMLMLLGVSMLGLIFAFFRMKENKRMNLNLLQKAATIKINLEEKEILLKEIHHRVKNNLQVISSLLNLNIRFSKNEVVIDTLRNSRNRIKSMALIHQKLYQEKNLKGVNIKEYITSLTGNLLHSYKTELKRIELILNVQDITLDADTVVPIGLIINELFSNSLKHAFPNKMKGTIQVNIFLTNEILQIQVIDNGVGYVSLESEKTFGYNLIKSIARKIEGEIITDNKSGTSVTINAHKFKIV